MIKLLDCTLRDGGYVNDWKFGKSAIKDIKENLELSGGTLHCGRRYGAAG